MEELDEMLVDMLCVAYKKIIYNEEKILKDMIGESLSLKEFQTLDIVYETMLSKSNTASTIAKKLGITLGTLSINVDRLISKGYLHKVKNENDRRVSYVELTEKGLQIRLKHDAMHKKFIREATSHLSPSEKASLLTVTSKLGM